MKIIGDFIKWYCYITTSIVIVCSVIFSLYNENVLPGLTLWNILLSGGLTTFVTIFIKKRETHTKKGAFLVSLVHYALLCMIMILCGKWFGWLDFDLPGIAMMTGAVAVVYLLVLGTHCLIDLREANEINRKLKKLYEDES